MADEIRRSGRANKGHHTKNADALDEQLNKVKPPKSKMEKKAQAKGEPSRSQSAQSGEPQEEEEDIYRCVCGDQREIRGRDMIMCDKCRAWQHNKCLGIPDSDYWEDKTYLCEVCAPENHVELLAAIARGEKPWNRKKGSKAAKPKARPSDVKAEATPEKKASTPQSAQAAATVLTPAPLPQETRSEASNGHVDAKPTTKATPKSQPQSPVGEKRSHEAIAEKETPNSKRRKSSAQHHENIAAPDPIPTELADLPEKERRFVVMLKTHLSSIVMDASKSRGYRIPQGLTPDSVATGLALAINHAVIKRHGPFEGNSSKYAVQIRRIEFNTKQNTRLVDRLLDNSLSPDEIASMEPEEMASEEKQKAYQAIREANEKQMVLIEETGPRLRKTHKGEEIVGQDNMPAEQEFRQPEPPTRESVEEGQLTEQLPQQSPQEDRAQAVELPEDLSRRSTMSIDTSNTQPQPDSVRRPSTTFDINSVFDKVRSPQHDQRAFLHRRQSSIRAQQTPHEGPVDDADVDRLLKDEDNDVEMVGYTADPTVVWRGTLDMQTLGPFDAVARFIAGGDFGQVLPWEQLLTSHLPILGRIESQRGNDYIQGLAQTGSHDVGVLAITPISPEGKHVFEQLFRYFHPRDRWGVVPVDKLNHRAMRDLYVIPVEPGGSELPPFLNMLEHCTIETPRPSPMLLLALVAKLPEPRPQQLLAPHFGQYPTADNPAGQAAQTTAQTTLSIDGPMNGPSPSPVNPHAPQYSPVQLAFPPGHNFGGPPQPQGHNGYPPSVPVHHQNPKAVEMLGPYIDAPVIVQLLSHSPDMHEMVMDNLRHIVETVPAARTDMKVLQDHMSQRTAQAQP